MKKTVFLLIVALPLLCFAVIKDTTKPFTAYSSAFINNGLYPKLYTCDSLSLSPPIAWKNIPEGTKSFAITMHHFPKDGDKHVYMVVYNIPSTVTSIPQAATNIGSWGSNTQNKNLSYSPPCSKGPGTKSYIITVYALSKTLSFKSSAVTMDELLEACKGNVLSTSALTVQYSR
jgi:Raf kinase inhibitor-like YbhB/YbcL family protein